MRLLSLSYDFAAHFIQLPLMKLLRTCTLGMKYLCTEKKKDGKGLTIVSIAMVIFQLYLTKLESNIYITIL